MIPSFSYAKDPFTEKMKGKNLHFLFVQFNRYNLTYSKTLRNCRCVVVGDAVGVAIYDAIFIDYSDEHW